MLNELNPHIRISSMQKIIFETGSNFNQTKMVKLIEFPVTFPWLPPWVELGILCTGLCTFVSRYAQCMISHSFLAFICSYMNVFFSISQFALVER